MTRPDDLPPLTEAQLEVINLVWEHGEMTVAGLWKALAARRPLARNTVLTTVSRLAEKGWLVQRAEGNVFHYSAAVPRDETVSGMVSRLVDTVFSGSAEGL